VPPPVSAIQQLMQDFISFLAREDLPHNKIPLVYYQILCIHPFENGNGSRERWSPHLAPEVIQTSLR
jgi:Fic family protein